MAKFYLHEKPIKLKLSGSTQIIKFFLMRFNILRQKLIIKEKDLRLRQFLMFRLKILGKGYTFLLLGNNHFFKWYLSFIFFAASLVLINPLKRRKCRILDDVIVQGAIMRFQVAFDILEI